MTGIKIKSSEFIGAGRSLSQLPPPLGIEVAVIGRSNVGKSTLINRMTGRKKLARTSATPGRTKEMNFFDVRLGIDDRVDRITLVDLPGFGFARASHQERQALAQMGRRYVAEREALRVVCLLNDCRRPPESEELAIRDLAFAHDKHLLVVLTKFDKLKQSEKSRSRTSIANAYGLEAADVIPTGERLPIAALWERIAALTVE